MKSYTIIIYTLMAVFSLSACKENGDIIGLEELRAYGFVKLTFEGRTPKGDDFKQTVNYSFVPGVALAGEVSYLLRDGEDDKYFYIARYAGTSGLDYYGEGYDPGDSEVSFQLAVQENGNDAPDISMDYFYISTTFTRASTQFFTIDDNISNYVDIEGIEDYSYDEATGKLRFTFKAVVPYDENDTGHGLVVHGEVNVNTYEQLETPR